MVGGLVVAGGGGYTLLNYWKKVDIGEQVAVKIEKENNGSQKLVCERWEDGIKWESYLDEPKCKSLFESLQRRSSETETKKLIIVESENSSEILQSLFSSKNENNQASSGTSQTQGTSGQQNGAGKQNSLDLKKNFKIDNLTCNSKENLVDNKIVVFCK
ncbi:hypothetical protein [Mycoplasma suis]|uniref:hypothetical protein n=1 Tax=Mycoplasma suis TaxID=57372 RepID=UPI00030F9323|nr:hypothetical protein [Mycoplasma suis]